MDLQIQKIPYASTWEIRHLAMWPNRPKEYVKLAEDKLGTHYGVMINEELVAVISYFIKNKEAQFRKFATLPDRQGKGYGTQLLTFLMDEISVQEVVKIWCNARIEKAFFYEKFGMRQTDTKFTKGGKDYVIMEKVLRK